MSQRKAAKHYGIPQSTLSDRLTGRSKGDVKPGRASAIPVQMEREIAKQAMRGAAEGFGTSRLQLMQRVGRVVRNIKLKNPFKNNIPGKEWFAGFKRRNPEVSLRSQEKTTTTRLRKRLLLIFNWRHIPRGCGTWMRLGCHSSTIHQR